jgi:hypothetical protein
MSSLRVASALALAAGLLAACSKPAGGGGAASGAGAGPSAPPAAAAIDPNKPLDMASLPRPKAGAWVMTNADDPHSTPDRNCYIDRPFHMKTPASCSKMEVHRTLTGGFSMDADCGRNGMTSKIHVVTEGDFQSHFVSQMQMSIALKPGEVHSSTMKMVYTYAGECTPAEKAQAERDAADAEREMNKPGAG